MAKINLSGQQAAYNMMAPKIQQLRGAMELRKEVWDKLPVEKKKAWIQSGKDPVMSLAWTIYKYLNNNFFGSDKI